MRGDRRGEKSWGRGTDKDGGRWVKEGGHEKGGEMLMETKSGSLNIRFSLAVVLAEFQQHRSP